MRKQKLAGCETQLGCICNLTLRPAWFGEIIGMSSRWDVRLFLASARQKRRSMTADLWTAAVERKELATCRTSPGARPLPGEHTLHMTEENDGDHFNTSPVRDVMSSICCREICSRSCFMFALCSLPAISLPRIPVPGSHKP